MDIRKRFLNHLYYNSNKRLLVEDNIIKNYAIYNKDLTLEEKKYIENLTDFNFNTSDTELLDDYYKMYDDSAKKLITANGKDLVKVLNKEGLSGIVFNVMCGGNVRDTMEFITRNRLIISNASILKLFVDVENNNNITDYNKFLSRVSYQLLQSKNNKQRILYLWLLGLTKKGLDNIVRGKENLFEYKTSLDNTLMESINALKSNFGLISGEIKLDNKVININWEIINLLFMAIGAQTLTIRGSSKSMSGKMFEKLVLGSCLTLMGFEYLEEAPSEIDPSKKYFWLSSISESDRETDATITYNEKAISIDIGFIGKGNPEIASDKLTRFRSYKDIGKISHLMRTIVIVDTIGNNSNLISIANDIEGSAIEMKDKLWVKQFAKILSEFFEVNCNIEDVTNEDLHEWLRDNTKEIDFTKFI
ncbi:CfrBI family restriction endonuclease [Staphylococcus pseudintermedius]|uniref:CfrBI family restriction endonuclease n=1 Tax=Staphylococcus pseudintermedius TaxID=283734 RepID=UPI001A08F642|nr:CfrBI family restriction endonuclease [Staphylococcus pseudintermedius]MDK3999448.1 CfrBI family restriction endonuclease [Staphylococcus pseudintermedius]